MPFRSSMLVLFSTCCLAAGVLSACGSSDDAKAGSGGSGAGAGSGAKAGSGGGGGSTFVNQCGVAAPLPAETGQCTAVDVAALTDFDDYAGSMPASYTYYVNAPPPAMNSLLGGVLHIDDGSAADGSVVATEMVPGVGGSGYALQISNSNAAHWGGLMMFYFPYAGSNAACLDARGYRGIEFSIKGSSPPRRFGVSLGMLDTVPTADKGLCDNVPSSGCKDATVELELPADATEWKDVQLPFSMFTPGVGRGLSCVPVSGQNLLRIVIQPFMSYPPPDYVLEPGAYTMAVDNLRFYR